MKRVIAQYGFVCQVKFTDWKRDGNLRQVLFLGLRDDKKAAQVTRELKI